MGPTTSNGSDDLALAALIVAVIAALASLGITWLLHRRAMRRADQANKIAETALNIERARLDREEAACVQPLEFDPTTAEVIYEVMGSWPLDEVEYQFRNYAGGGGAIRKPNVSPGVKRIGMWEFEGEGSLTTPGERMFAASARWKRSANDDWEDSGVHTARKGHLTFVRAGSADDATT